MRRRCASTISSRVASGPQPEHRVRFVPAHPVGRRAGRWAAVLAPALVDAVEIRLQHRHRLAVRLAFVEQFERVREREIAQGAPLESPPEHGAVHLSGVVVEPHAQEGGLDPGSLTPGSVPATRPPSFDG